MQENFSKILHKWHAQQSSIKASQLFLCGLERESMRVQNDCWIAKTPHPPAAGSPLTHPFITTDFAEALLEFATPPIADAEELIHFLDGTQKLTSDILHENDEQLWPLSMPPAMEDPEKIEIAGYGRSYPGRLRHIYRRGLALRYGKRMQTIAGIHFNFSFRKDFFELRHELSGELLSSNQLYFHLMRNYLRITWLINYLFGASPALDTSFFGDNPPPSFLKPLGERTLFHPVSACLRMSSLGYVNQDARLLRMCFNNLENYLNALGEMLTTEHPRYAAAGIKDASAEYQQLNTNILQIENEYYASIRPKSTRGADEKTIDMLRKDGVEYVEIRNLDIDPFLPAGIDEHRVRFLQLLMTYCAIKDSPLIDNDECERIERAETHITAHNLDPQEKFVFASNDKPKTIAQAAQELLEELTPLAELLDRTGQETEDRVYSQSLAYARARSEDPTKHPAKRFIHLLQKEKLEYLEAGSLLKNRHKEYYAAFTPQATLQQRLAAERATSLEKERQLAAMHPADDPQDFDKYLQTYITPKLNRSPNQFPAADRKSKAR